MKNNFFLYRLGKKINLEYEIKPFRVDPVQPGLKLENTDSFIINYDSGFRTGIKENDRVYSELFVPLKYNEEASIIILLHGFTSKLHRLENYYDFIAKAAGKGLSCLFIHLPYHLNRTPPGEMSGQRLIQNKDIETLDFFNQSVLDIEKGILIVKKIFLEDHPVKKNRVKKLTFSICGLSLGGMVSVVAMAWEKNIKKGILIQCGGNWDSIYWNSLVRVIMHGCFIDKEKIKRKQAQKFYLPIHEFIEKYKQIEPGNIDCDLSGYPVLSEYPQKTWFLTDPLTFAHKIKPENIIMIDSRFDLLFCRESTLQLWNELGRPKIYWFNDFHTSKILSRKKVLGLIFNFLDSSNIFRY